MGDRKMIRVLVTNLEDDAIKVGEFEMDKGTLNSGKIVFNPKRYTHLEPGQSRGFEVGYHTRLDVSPSVLLPGVHETL